MHAPLMMNTARIYLEKGKRKFIHPPDFLLDRGAPPKKDFIREFSYLLVLLRLLDFIKFVEMGS